MKKLQAVVVTYNSQATLPACLTSLKKNGIEQPIIIDNTLRNRGFAVAANEGARQATAPLLLFLNPDAELLGENLDEVVSYFEDHQNVGVIGLVLQDKNGVVETRSFGPPLTPLRFITRHFKAVVATPAEAFGVGWTSGGALAIRRELFEQLHGFDEHYFLYWEDVDLCDRVRAAGYEVVVLPEVRVQHQRGASFVSQQQKTAFYDQSADRYVRTHYAASIWHVYSWLRRVYRLFYSQAR